jgi:hypothetical protein
LPIIITRSVFTWADADKVESKIKAAMIVLFILLRTIKYWLFPIRL